MIKKHLYISTQKDLITQNFFMAISDVQHKGSYLQVFDESGKKISELYASGVDLLGVAGDFFVVEKGSYYVTCDKHSKKIAELYSSGMSFKSAAGSTFNVRRGSYIVSYDEDCKKTGERYSP